MYFFSLTDMLIARGCPADHIVAKEGGPTTGRKAKFLYAPRMREMWDTIKIQVMRYALCEKFFPAGGEKTDVADAMSLTGAEKDDRWVYFVEHVRRDRQWGDGEDGSGTNMLGKMLTDLRLGGCDASSSYRPGSAAEFLKVENRAFVRYT